MINEINLKKIELFYTLSQSVHILKLNKIFHNGNIIKINYENTYIIIEDFRTGPETILFDEIVTVDKYKPKEVMDV